MKVARSTTKSQLCAAGITLAAVVLMLAPLRRGPVAMETRHASFIPILAAGGVAETPSFRRLASVRPATASAKPLVRSPRGQGTPVLRSAPPAKALAHDFSAPRVNWRHLGAETRGQLDAATASGAAWKTVELHGSSIPSGGQLGRLHREVRGSVSGHPYDVVLERGEIRFDASKAPSDTLHLCFVGDFHTEPPSAEQLAAFDELLDYLTIKLGAVELRMHQHGAQSCLGAAFPSAEIARALENSR